MSIREEVYKLLALGKSTKEIASILNVTIRAVQKHKKDFDEANGEQKNERKSERRTNEKIKKEKAKALIETGATLSETVAQTGTTIDIAKKLSSKEKLREKQKEFLNSLKAEYIDNIKANKKERFNNNTGILRFISKAVEEECIDKATQELLLKNEQTEQEIFETSRLERYEKLEFEKLKYKNEMLKEFTEKLDTLTEEQIYKVLEFIESLGSDNNADFS